MLFQNNKYDLVLQGGEASKKLDSMFGVIQHFSIVPMNKDTIWSVRLLDKDFDVIYEVIDHEGRLDEREDILIGNQVSEAPTLKIFDSTSNEKFKVIVKVREIV